MITVCVADKTVSVTSEIPWRWRNASLQSKIF